MTCPPKKRYMGSLNIIPLRLSYLLRINPYRESCRVKPLFPWGVYKSIEILIEYEFSWNISILIFDVPVHTKLATYSRDRKGYIKVSWNLLACLPNRCWLVFFLYYSVSVLNTVYVLDIEPPRQLLVHSHWTVNNEKMSKSKMNVVDPVDRSLIYTKDGLRYFLLREGVPHSDGSKYFVLVNTNRFFVIYL